MLLMSNQALKSTRSENKNNPESYSMSTKLDGNFF